MMDAKTVAQKIGRKVLFIGVEAQNWSVADFGKAAANARTLGFDSICAKRADGSIKWYQNEGHMRLERQVCLSAGVGYIPFLYAYGPRFSGMQYQAEATILLEMMSACEDAPGSKNGVVCVDMEVEWNGQEGPASTFAGLLKDAPGAIILSTWADPDQQNYNGVIKALLPVCAGFGPQEYTGWLSNQEVQLERDGVVSTAIFPAIDVSDNFNGQNNPFEVFQLAVQRGHLSVWVWEYAGALANPSLIKGMLALFDKAAGVATGKITPATPPAPAHAVSSGPTWGTYVVHAGDTLTSIATRLSITNWFSNLYLPNKNVLDQVAQQHGQPNAANGSLIYAGTQLKYPVA